jgi:hypothetical protein
LTGFWTSLAHKLSDLLERFLHGDRGFWVVEFCRYKVSKRGSLALVVFLSSGRSETSMLAVLQFLL